MPKVSIIIPTYNRARLIYKAIESILNQSYQDFEIIIVDDGSTDNTREIVQKYIESQSFKVVNPQVIVKYIWQENRGPAAARNRGIREATGKYIALLDSDDIWFYDYLNKQVLFLEKNINFDIVCRSIFVKDGSLGRERRIIGHDKPDNVSTEMLILDGYLSTCGSVFKQECFSSGGEYDEKLRGDEDIDLLFRLSQKFNIKYINDPLGECYKHMDNWTSQPERVILGHLNVCKKNYKICTNRALKKLLRKKIAKSHYLLGRYLYDEGLLFRSIKHFFCAIFTSPSIGTIFFNFHESMLKKYFKIIKPLAIPFILLFFSPLIFVITDKRHKT